MNKVDYTKTCLDEQQKLGSYHLIVFMLGRQLLHAGCPSRVKQLATLFTDVGRCWGVMWQYLNMWSYLQFAYPIADFI